MVLARGHNGTFVCVQCGSSFKANHYAAKYCSFQCSRVVGRARRCPPGRSKPCLDCGTSIKVHVNVVRCDSCKAVKARDGHLHYKYKLAPGEYDRMFDQQGGVCVICGEPPRDWEGGRLSLDHDHATGKARGLLHRTCNSALGHFPSEAVLQAAIDYLRMHNSAAPVGGTQ